MSRVRTSDFTLALRAYGRAALQLRQLEVELAAKAEKAGIPNEVLYGLQVMATDAIAFEMQPFAPKKRRKQRA